MNCVSRKKIKRQPISFWFNVNVGGTHAKQVADIWAMFYFIYFYLFSKNVSLNSNLLILGTFCWLLWVCVSFPLLFPKFLKIADVTKLFKTKEQTLHISKIFSCFHSVLSHASAASYTRVFLGPYFDTTWSISGLLCLPSCLQGLIASCGRKSDVFNMYCAFQMQIKGSYSLRVYNNM